VVVVGDLAGDTRYHAGDEAMAVAALELLESLDPDGGPRVIVTSSDPAATSARLGCDAADWVGFAACHDDDARFGMLETITASVKAHLASGDTGSAGGRGGGNIPPLLEAVATADAVLVAGGGNLNSDWPEHLFERVLVARAAAHAGIPVVISGQTLGPRIDDHHRPLLIELLTTAQMVGVREHRSFDLAVGLGVDPNRLVLHTDDALLLADSGVPPLPVGFDPGTPAVPRRFMAVTIHPFAPPDDHRMTSLAAQLATVANRVGAQLLFVPHMRGPEGPGNTSDADVARHLAQVTGGWAMPDPDAAGAAWAARNAWVVVSTRYHPLVFATGAAVPSLALLWDHYTAVKCRGALDHVGLGNWWVGVEPAAGGVLEPALAEVTRRRVEIASWLHLNADRLGALDMRRRRRVAAALGLDDPGDTDEATSSGRDVSASWDSIPDLPSPGRTAPQPAGHWTHTQR